MAKTKIQKKEAIQSGSSQLKKSETIVLTDFSGLSVNDLNSLRRAIREIGGVFQVIKKRLLKIILDENKVLLDPKSLDGQMGVVFSNKDIVETANVVYKFSKQNEKLKILAGFDLKGNKLIESQDVKRIGQLPSREVLLAQLVYMISMPIRQFMIVLNEKSKKG